MYKENRILSPIVTTERIVQIERDYAALDDKAPFTKAPIYQVRDLYEADRQASQLRDQKVRDVMQKLVDLLKDGRVMAGIGLRECYGDVPQPFLGKIDAALRLASEHGITPTQS